MLPQARRENIVVQTAADETLVYDLTANKAYLLNKTSAFIWQICDGTKNVAQLSAELAVEFNQKSDESLVWLAIEQLKTNDLLENAAEIPNLLAGSSRREAIKKIGLSTMIALPVISNLLAPTVAQAASGCIADGAVGCTVNNNTRSNCCNTNQRCVGSTCTTCYPPGGVAGTGATATACQIPGNRCCSGTAQTDGSLCLCN